MKTLIKSVVALLLLLSVSVISGCDVYTYSTSDTQTYYQNPDWAPQYYTGTRYYYFPDIECYYDLSTREFIYLNNGLWGYSQYLPTFYSGYDLSNGFVVVINSKIYQPWMHHQYFVSHYPRYYYIDYYDHSNFPYVRGFNENSKSAIYWQENERYRARSWDDQNVRYNRQFKYSEEDRLQQQRHITNSGPTANQNSNKVYDRNTTQTNQSNNTTRNNSNEDVSRRTQNENVNPNRTTNTDNSATRQGNGATTRTNQKADDTNYYGRKIGQPVKVERQMRERTTTRSNDNSTSSGRRTTTDDSNTNKQESQGRR